MGGFDNDWVCLECRGWNRAGYTACWLCGRRLDTARPESSAGDPRSPISFTSPEPIDPYTPPTTFVSTPLSFRISSLLMLIAVIAVCLGVAHENPSQGIILAVAVVPALVYTVVVVRGRHARGMPMAALDKASAFLVAIGGVVIIEFSALVAFCMTCYPVGFVFLFVGYGRRGFPWWSWAGLAVAFVAGAIAAVAAAAYMTRFLLGRKARRSGISGKS